MSLLGDKKVTKKLKEYNEFQNKLFMIISFSVLIVGLATLDVKMIVYSAISIICLFYNLLARFVLRIKLSYLLRIMVSITIVCVFIIGGAFGALSSFTYAFVMQCFCDLLLFKFALEVFKTIFVKRNIKNMRREEIDKEYSHIPSVLLVLFSVNFSLVVLLICETIKYVVTKLNDHLYVISSTQFVLHMFINMLILFVFAIAYYFNKKYKFIEIFINNIIQRYRKFKLFEREKLKKKNKKKKKEKNNENKETKDNKSKVVKAKGRVGAKKQQVPNENIKEEKNKEENNKSKKPQQKKPEQNNVNQKAKKQENKQVNKQGNKKGKQKNKVNENKE